MSNILENITSIEISKLVIDSIEPSNYMIIHTKRQRYAFKLSENISDDKLYNVFKAFATDLNTPIEPPKTEEKPVEEKHDGKTLLDTPIEPPTDVEITVQEQGE